MNDILRWFDNKTNPVPTWYYPYFDEMVEMLESEGMQ